MYWLEAQSPMIKILLAVTFIWFMTTLGAATVFFFKDINRKLLDMMLGFAAGIMLAASFWSLLAPAIAMAELTRYPAWIPAAGGFLLGGAFLFVIDKTIPHLHLGFPDERKEGIKTSWHRSVLLVLAITLHNIPEGLAVGVAFGALTQEASSVSLAGAVAIAIGIGIQDFPEGMAVSIPLRREGISRLKSFWWGQVSGFVEFISGIIGALAVIMIKPLLPWALSFAAGAMIYVVVEEIIPEAQLGNNQDTDLATIGIMLGFMIMMILDVALK